MKFFWERSKSAEPASQRDDRPAGDDSAYPRELQRLESAAVEKRRAEAGLEPRDPQLPIGLACSGGGIRSATVCLGVFQALARSRFLRRIDYLSTVSGGGYIGTFLGHLYLRDYVDPKKDQAGKPTNAAGADGYVLGVTPAERVSRILEDSHTKPLAHLRENGRYLSPNGSGDSLLAGAVVLRNWVAIQLVLLTFCMAGLFGFLLLRTLVATAVRAFGLGELRIGPTSFIAGFFSYFDPLTKHPVWISDYFLLAALPVAVLAVPVGLAYWLIESNDLLITAALGALTLALAYFLRAEGLGAFLLVVAAFWLLSAVLWAVATQGGRWFAASEEALLRRGNLLSQILKAALMIAGVVSAVALIDTLGRNLYLHQAAWVTTKIFALLGTLLMFGKRLVPFISNFTRGGRPKISVSLIAGIAAIVLLAVLLGFLSGLTYSLVELMSFPQVLQGWIAYWDARVLGAAGGFLGFGLLCLILGHTMSFLNRSSLQTLYSARLTRAYLGASNPGRWERKGMRISDAIPGDAVSWEEYRPERHGGPLHLINTTINETIDGRSQVEQRDRKGVPLATGPFGLSVGVRHHALWKNAAGSMATGHLLLKRTLEPLSPASGFRIFAPSPKGGPIEVEPLRLGEWVGISGAAFTTGIGYRTSLGLSLLSGMANVRLGYWWNSGVDPANRDLETPPRTLQKLARLLPLFPVQRLLLNELLARFPGTAVKRWYLSDGGHFENTAAYELIRRRLPLIIILDNGADPDCLFEDMGSLVRKARLDFDTEIHFAGEGSVGITKKYEESIGTLSQLKPARPAEGAGRPRSARHIAAAAVHYPDGQRGLLLLVKPTLHGNEPTDVLQYAANHPSFPQEPTSDQFFDEAQWESYRKLGEHIGAQLSEILESLPAEDADGLVDAVVN